MIYFITNSKYENFPESITITNDINIMYTYINDLDEIGLDLEFNGLNEFYATPLLAVLGDNLNTFVIDLNTVDISELNSFTFKKFIGHNIKIDIKILRIHFGIDIRNCYDTLITEQRLGLGSGRSNALDAVYLRRCKKYLPEDKTTRMEFTVMNKSSRFTPKHIIYAAHDVKVLFEIKEVQKGFIERFNYHHLLYNIEFPLIPILADAEIEGIELNEPLWKENIERNKKEQLELEQQMDRLLINLNAVKYKSERKVVEVTQTSLFPSLIEEKISTNRNLGKIQYSSPSQILNIFERLKVPKPQGKKTAINKITKVKETVIEDSTGEAALEDYILSYPKSPLRPFIETLLKHRSVTKNISSFGNRFLVANIKAAGKPDKLGYKNLKTGKVHTIYRQCFADTGRFQSGDEKNGYFNSQQVPAEVRMINGKKVAIYRVPFQLSQKEIDEGWKMTTADLSGAEGVIIAAFAKDPQLKKWLIEDDDLHSPMATLCYLALYQYRKANKIPLIIKDSYGKEYLLTEDFKIDKTLNKQLRTDFKTITFGAIYGASPVTVAYALKIKVEEGEVILNTIKKAIPNAFKMVEVASAQAIKNGYVVHNSVTNSRRIFSIVLEGRATKKDLIDVGMKARNSRIQGTQADLLKEAIVLAYNRLKEAGIPNCFLLQVHDELVWKHKGDEGGLIIANAMRETAKKYLEGFAEMDVEFDTLTSWTK